MHTQEQPSIPTGANGFGQWAGLYVSGILLVVLVLAHIVAVHYAGDFSVEGYRFTEVTRRMASPLYRFALLGLLLVGLFHGLLGFHRFVADLGVCGRRSLRVLSVVLTVTGVVGLTYGWLIYQAFMGL